MKIAFDIDALRAMVTGVDLDSFSRASIELGRSQSAVSMQIKKLEQQVNAALFTRKGRKLIPTHAGEMLISYARQIIALNDEAAMAIGAAQHAVIVRLGMPQDFFESALPTTWAAFSKIHPDILIDIRAGDNHKLADEVNACRLDGAIIFAEEGTTSEGELLCKLPMRWLAHQNYSANNLSEKIPLVLFEHPCLFRKAALAAFEKEKKQWRAAITTPSLHFVWAALRSHLGIGVRVEYNLPEDIKILRKRNLPNLPCAELRLLRAKNTSIAAADLCTLFRDETLKLLKR